MSLSSLYLAWVEDLPPRQYGVRRIRGIGVAMADGVVLKTDHYAPRGDGPFPTILMRLPYGRRGFRPIAEAYAERGFNVVVQACRGTERSGGQFDPFADERADGLATLDWLAAQPWYDGRIGLTGPSYLGYAQWAIADALPPTSALATKVTTAHFGPVVFPGGAFHLGLWLSWLQVIEGLRSRPLATAARMLAGDIERRTEKAALVLPLVEADRAAVGHKVPFWRRWFRDAVGNDAFWDDLDHRERLTASTPPVHFISGWYDFMVDPLLADYRRLADLGHRPYLTIGSWVHVAEELQRDNLRETLAWMRAHLLGDPSALRARPVRLHISGRDQWHEFDAYPPAPMRSTGFALASAGVLRPGGTGDEGISQYRYDPADPTPNLGGAIFAFTGAGPLDNAPLEARSDVLSFTSPPLEAELTVIGQPVATIVLEASSPHLDLFARLNHVGLDGVSRNICDGLLRLTPGTPRAPDGTCRITLPLHATAHSFARGTRLRLLIASGAHPRYARNPGTGEHIGTATALTATDVRIHHAGSGLTLPVHDLG